LYGWALVVGGDTHGGRAVLLQVKALLNTSIKDLLRSIQGSLAGRPRCAVAAGAGGARGAYVFSLC
jgi:hypothetical protein